MERNWRDAKIPQWVKDSIATEMAQWELTAALSWPTEPKPQPLPFHWGGYDRLHGEALSERFGKLPFDPPEAMFAWRAPE